jgi:membrane protease YdiL (CAAX protease family)
MNTNSTRIGRFSLPAFLILTPLISLAIALFLPIPTTAKALLVILVPPIMAILLTAFVEGGKHVAALLKMLFQWRVSLKWYAVALGLPIGIILVAGLLAVLLGWIPALQIQAPAPSQLISNAVLILLVAVFEEFGWRGYALPRLLIFRSPLTSALLIGIAWGILHIGIGLSGGRPWLPTFLSPLAASVVLTWLFVNTRGSLPMAILFHFAFDYSPQFLYGITIPQLAWVQTIVLVALALSLILVFGVNLQRGHVKGTPGIGAEQMEMEQP